MSERATPRTAKAWQECLTWCHQRGEVHDPHHAALATLAEELEREVGELREALEGLFDLVEQDESYTARGGPSEMKAARTALKNTEPTKS